LSIRKRVQDAAQKLTSRFTSSASRRLSPSSTTSILNRGIEWIYLLVLFLLIGGVINAASNSGQAGINLEAIVPSGTSQNASETIIMLFSYIVGTLGAYALYLSGRQTIRARSGEMFFVGGLALLSVALAIGYYVLSQK
jgi:hypothetical protein